MNFTNLNEKELDKVFCFILSHKVYIKMNYIVILSQHLSVKQYLLISNSRSIKSRKLELNSVLSTN